MSDKFDYFICMMLKGKKLTLEDIDEQKTKSPRGKQRPQTASFINRSSDEDSLDDDSKNDINDMRERFKEFQDNAYCADLGDREMLRQESQAGNGLKRMGTGWLNNLANLVENEDASDKQESFL